MKSRPFVSGAAALALGVALAACAAPGHTTSFGAPGPTSPAQASPAAPPLSPVSQQATVTGTCVTGIDDLSANDFYSMSSLTEGSSPASGDYIAEAYQLTLTDASSSATAAIAGFAVVFYSQGQELNSDNETFANPTFITPGQSLTWTEHPWRSYVAGQDASVGPFAAGVTGAVDSVATCQLVQWYHG